MSFVKFLYPGMWVMRKMRFGTKLALLALIVLVPLITIVTEQVLLTYERIELTQSEIGGIKAVEDLTEVARLLQAHRGQTNIKLLGGDSVEVSTDPTRAALTEAISRIAQHQDILPKEWPQTKARLDSLYADLAGKTAPQSLAIHSAIVSDLRRVVYGVADISGLLYDPDPVAFLQMEVVVYRLMPLRDEVGKIRGTGAALLSEETLEESGLGRIQAAVDDLLETRRQLEYPLSLLAAKGFDEGNYKSVVEVMDEFVKVSRLRFKEGSDSGGAKAYYDLGGKVTASIGQYQKEISQALRQNLETRLVDLHRDLLLITALSALAVIGLVYLLFAFNVSFLADLKQVLRFMEETASGNMRYVVRIQGRDELSDMSHSMGVMVNNISVMVASVRSNAALVAGAGESLVAASASLSDRTEQQAANLEETSASVQEVAATVKENASAAIQSDTAAQQVSKTAESGAGEMSHAIKSIEAIEASTRRMDEIVGVIDGLAFQTNILALNAAVEAARAGESGRGFAVVATEVRTLAQRSAASAKEIRQLITTSTAQVAAGVQQIRTAAKNITTIADGVRGVAGNMSVISASSAEQSASLSEITTAIRQLDEITQQNAAMVEQAVSQATALQERANVLADAVSVFKLQQGSADEARALVARALSMRRSAGSRDAFIRAVTPKESGLVDRDMYVFVLDRNGQYLAFCGNSAKVGTRVQDVAGIDGNALMASIVSQASVAPGWVDYDIVNPLSGKVQTKMSYVVQVDDVYVGCGVYKTLMAAV
ncbi:methyl-accepting chemotaxis protein [Rhodoferax sp.]|uniref:methyl-accepting chemotaxis protein n=1 Tax=Rhodoferax sp. TaxID=50421 RepID=UPI002ACD8238|nr:methyl-accepting chemotaxis protein [Rhodoferax sp.]MDZ7920291.1 methyl-accepting chemotaxis protein [Rhodoferax sp.]